MAQILVPSADIAANSWTTTPLWSKVDDDSTANPTGDGTVITSDAVGNNAQTTVADLGPLVVAGGGTPGTPQAGTVTIRARWNHDQPGRTLRATCELWQGTPGSGTLIATLQVDPDVGSSETESTYALTAGERGNVTDWTNLSFRAYGFGTGGGPTRALVIDLVELETPDAGASPVTVQLVPATASVSAQAFGVSLGALSVELVPGTLAASAQPLTPSLGALSVELVAAALTATPQPLGVSLGAATVELVAATATVTAQPLVPQIAGSPVTVELVPATASLVSQALTPSLAPLSVELVAASGTLIPQPLGVTPQPLTVELVAAVASLVAQALSPQVGGSPVTVELVPASASLAAQPLGVSLSPVTVELSPALASVIAQALAVNTGTKLGIIRVKVNFRDRRRAAVRQRISIRL